MKMNTMTIDISKEDLDRVGSSYLYGRIVKQEGGIEFLQCEDRNLVLRFEVSRYEQKRTQPDLIVVQETLLPLIVESVVSLMNDGINIEIETYHAD